MNTGIQHQSPWRRIPLAVAAVAVLSAGLIPYGMFASPSGRAEVSSAQGPTSQPPLPLESWYFPAQYVNQATEMEEPIWIYW